MENKPNQPAEKSQRDELSTDQQIRRRTIKAFALFGLASLVPYGVWKWIGSRPKVNGLPDVFRRVLDANEQVNNAFFSHRKLAPTFPVERAARQVRVNGRIGLQPGANPADWQLRVEQPALNAPPRQLTLSLDDIKALPKHDLVFNFKCVEGWSQIQHWSGARFADFVAEYKLGTRNGETKPVSEDWFRYVGLETPDGKYYVGLDMESALHPQTLLAYEMNGEPLTGLHGSPLRLMIPVKYGVKSLKCIGRIVFSDERPRDFWHRQGYDYNLAL
ncbi:hypothetical protein GCM10023189_19130 [Nibrella saemangeumensis]|uniref:Oxidoreductase molybdopterin-binding domain-containing protein n=1 Tax=Nibrella saemangeumensis TaxID=1084526 RepID=A0ABP8MRJ6_9BACT